MEKRANLIRILQSNNAREESRHVDSTRKLLEFADEPRLELFGRLLLLRLLLLSHRPKNTTITKTRSESDEEDEEGGWSKVGATPRHSTNSTTPSASSERPAWARSESWIKRSEQQRQLHASSQPSSQQPPISHWNNRDVAGGDSAVWKDRNQMVASVKKTSTTESPTAPVPQPTAAAAPAQAQSTENEVTPADQHIPIPAYAPNSATWSNNPMGGGGIFYQLPQPGPAPPIVKEGPIEFYYVDPTDTRRGPFAKDQMSVWFKAGYFNDESLRVQRGEKGEYKTIGELKKENGVSTPFDYPEDVEKPRVVAAPLTGYPSAAGVNTTTAAAAATNPMFPLGGMGMWGQQPDLYAVMQTNFEQQMILERQRLMEEHQRRVAEEAKKMAEFQEAMYRQLSMQQELTNQQLREQELALQRHREELERREKDALAIQHQMEAEARELKERKAALEAEDRRKRQAEEQLLQEQQQREAAAKEAADRVRRAEEAAEKERIRLDAEARQAEETIRQLRLKQELETRQKVEEAARKKAEERERLAKEAASARQKAELDAVWTGVKATTVSISTTALQASAPPPPPPTSAQAQPKQVSPSASDDSEGWMPIGKEVKHTKAAPWAPKVEEPVKTEKTLLEIQREEERQLKAEREQQAKLKVKDAKELKSSVAKEEKSASSWGGAKTWAAPDTGSSSKSYVSPFLDGPSLEAANKVYLLTLL
uniref:GYF domain-containing protein n=1 Tax=Caenorhabditis japonica TaxID=281687 RepID=A0A8R1DQ83_CAEJA